MPRSTFFFALLFLSAVLMTISFGCGSSDSQGEAARSGSSPVSDAVPELSDDTIRERINNAYVRKVPEESGAGEPIGWSFSFEEPKDITVVEKQIEGNHATLLLDVKTGTGPRARQPRYLAGQIRTQWELRTGWVLRQWEIVDVENISMKYKNLPKPTEQNANR
jgi:hypothetical protein